MDSTNAPSDQHWMRLALQLAANGQGHVEPNPMVGCVIVKDGRRIGQGFHQQFGKAHAEIVALNSLASRTDAIDATAYVTLEPCCHYGKTPPCCEALIDAKVRRVVVAMRDPFPRVDGGGIEQLSGAGIEVTVGVMQRESEMLSAPYLKRLRTGLPWVIAKWAMTVDGRIATASGESQWISGERSRHEVHRLRSRVDAVLVGMGTVIADDPMLNARISADDSGSIAPARIAKRVVLCNQRLPSPDAKLVRTANDLPTWLFASRRTNQNTLSDLANCGVRVFRIDADNPRTMIHRTLETLCNEGMTNVMVEGGAGLLGSFLGADDQSCLIDECHVYLGAKLFGGKAAPGPIAGEGINRIQLAPALELVDVDRFEQDVRVIYRRQLITH